MWLRALTRLMYLSMLQGSRNVIIILCKYIIYKSPLFWSLDSEHWIPDSL